MSIPTSDDGTLIAVTARPDWAQAVTVTYGFDTKVFLSRTGKEQRQRGRVTPKARIAWVTTGATLAEAQAAMVQAQVEARAICLVPFWTESTLLITSTAGDVVTIGVDPREDFYAVGQWVFMQGTDGTTSFRQITAVVGRILTLAASVGAPEMPIDSRIYPCRKCLRVLADDALTRDNLTSHTIKYEYSTVSP